MEAGGGDLRARGGVPQGAGEHPRDDHRLRRGRPLLQEDRRRRVRADAGAGHRAAQGQRPAQHGRQVLQGDRRNSRAARERRQVHRLLQGGRPPVPDRGHVELRDELQPEGGRVPGEDGRVRGGHRDLRVGGHGLPRQQPPQVLGARLPAVGGHLPPVRGRPGGRGGGAGALRGDGPLVRAAARVQAPARLPHRHGRGGRGELHERGVRVRPHLSPGPHQDLAAAQGQEEHPVGARRGGPHLSAWPRPLLRRRRHRRRRAAATASPRPPPSVRPSGRGVGPLEATTSAAAVSRLRACYQRHLSLSGAAPAALRARRKERRRGVVTVRRS
mmetsp:Transcript_1818/g.6483  ORF Transcript_1818/g.6483 Transcript_1818/m.6483 type:complete len:329 (+) Transcript_1818:424-1410(+)